MKYLLLILCLFNATIYSQTNFTEAERDNFIQAMKKGDYSILLPFVKKENLNTFIPLRNGDIVIKDAPFEVDKVEDKSITEPFEFKQANKTIIYTNQYGAEFLNNQEILWDLKEIKSMHNAVCYGFYDMMKKYFKTKEPQKIINLYKDYSTEIPRNFRGILVYIIYALESFYDINYYDLNMEFSEEEKNKIADYLFYIIYPTKEQQRIALLNLPLYRLAIYSGKRNIIRVHYNQEFPPNPWQEYKCPFKK